MRAFFDQDVVATDTGLDYGGGALQTKLDFYHMRGRSGAPTVVFVHGGYWSGQDKDYYKAITGLYGNVGLALAKRGLAVAVIDYHLVPDTDFDGQLADVMRAVAWVKAHAGEHGGDGGKLVLAGHSSGGHLTALTAFDPAVLAGAGLAPDAIKGYVALSPILDLVAMRDKQPAAFNRKVTAKVFGLGDAALAARSPKSFFHAVPTPLFLGYGADDYPYLREQIEANLPALAADTALTVRKLAGHSHEDMVLNFDTDDDELSADVAGFVAAVFAD